MKAIKENNNHIFISGQTRSGKTFFAGRALSQLAGPVLFFNLQEERLPNNFIVARSNKISFKQLLGALRDGKKIDLRFPIDEETTQRIQGFIIKNLMFAGFNERRPIYIVFDECHLLRGPALDYAVQAATRGLKRGMRCVFITQRPALCSKTLYTQASEQYIFYIAPSEAAYLRAKGLDYAELQKEWKKLGKYSFVYYDGFKLEGRKAI